MEISFWNGDPNAGGQHIPGEVTRDENGLISLRSQGNYTLDDVWLLDGDGNTVRVPLGRMIDVHPQDWISVQGLEDEHIDTLGA